MKTAIVVADEKHQELVFNFHPIKDDPEINLSIPAASVGHLVAQIAAAHQSFALKANDISAALLPLKLSGVRVMDSAQGNILLLQFEGVFELAVIVDPENLDKLANAALLAAGPSTYDPPKPN